MLPAIINTPISLFLGAYFLLINIAAFLFFGIDKMKAGLRHRRVRERTLFVLALLGGSIGALAAMNLFRHKTKKVSFQTILMLIVLLHIFLAFAFIRFAQ